MRRLLYLATLSMVVMLLFTQTVLAQEDGGAITARGAETAPLNADGTCPEGFVPVNAPFCAEESPNTPGRIFGYGEGDLASQPAASAQYQQYAAAQQYTPATGLPSTGGPAILLPAAGLLLATGLIGMRLVRRS